jgi:hypothetical protein
MGVSEQTFDTWKRKYAGLGVSELREWKVLPAENQKWKQLVADRSLDTHILQEVLAKKHGSPPASGSWRTNGVSSTTSPAIGRAG